MTYCYTPKVETDLTRYLQYVDELKGVSFMEAAVTGRYGYRRNYSFVYYCWILSNLGLKRLVPAIPVFFIYYVGLYVTCRVGTDLKASRRDILTYILILLLTLNFFAVENNVRNVFAFCMIAFAVFRASYLKKKDIWTLLLYVLPIFLHTSAIIFVALRVVVGVLRHIKYHFQSLLAIILLVPFVPEITKGLYGFLVGIKSDNILLKMLLHIVESANTYYTGSGAEWAIAVSQSGSEKLAKLLYTAFAITVVVLILIHYFSRLKEKKMVSKQHSLLETQENNEAKGCESGENVAFNDISERLSLFLDYQFLVGGLTLASVPMVMPEYWRFVSVLITFGGVFYLLTKANSKGYSITKKMLWIFLALAPVCAALWARNWIMYTDGLQTILSALVCNPIVILIVRLCGTSWGLTL